MSLTAWWLFVVVLRTSCAIVVSTTTYARMYRGSELTYLRLERLDTSQRNL